MNEENPEIRTRNRRIEKDYEKGQTKYKSLKEEKDWDDEIEKEAQEDFERKIQ